MVHFIPRRNDGNRPANCAAENPECIPISPFTQPPTHLPSSPRSRRIPNNRCVRVKKSTFVRVDTASLNDRWRGPAGVQRKDEESPHHSRDAPHRRLGSGMEGLTYFDRSPPLEPLYPGNTYYHRTQHGFLNGACEKWLIQWSFIHAAMQAKVVLSCA